MSTREVYRAVGIPCYEHRCFREVQEAISLRMRHNDGQLISRRCRCGNVRRRGSLQAAIAWNPGVSNWPLDN
jgi:hypothetical protein